MFRKSLIILVLVFFSACNVESGKSTSTSSTITGTQANNGTTPSSNTQTNGNTAGTSGSSSVGNSSVPTTSNLIKDQTQTSGVPEVPNFGFGF